MTGRLVPADDAALDEAAACLGAGRAVIIPTDTVYGLAVDATRPGATDRLFALKDRPRDLPLAVLVADADQAWTVGEVDAGVLRLAGRFWPGALTIVVRRRVGWTADLGHDGGTVGLRCPEHRWVRALCRKVGPVATTSANLHGRASPTEAASAGSLFGVGVALIVDGGICAGEPSTVVDCTADPPKVLRQGSVIVDV